MKTKTRMREKKNKNKFNNKKNKQKINKNNGKTKQKQKQTKQQKKINKNKQNFWGNYLGLIIETQRLSISVVSGGLSAFLSFHVVYT